MMQNAAWELGAPPGAPYNPLPILAKADNMAERRTIHFTGRVQGVGFRMTTVHLSKDLPVTGQVRNLDDGGVELIVEGSPADINTLVTRLREHFGSLIRNVRETSAPASGVADTGIRISH
jgi:acylphosphatase